MTNFKGLFKAQESLPGLFLFVGKCYICCMGDTLKQKTLSNAQVLTLAIFLITTTVTVVSTGLGVYYGLKQTIRDEMANMRLLEQRVATLERICKIAEIKGPYPQDPVKTNNTIKYTEAIFPEHSVINRKLPKKLYYGDNQKT